MYGEGGANPEAIVLGMLEKEVFFLKYIQIENFNGCSFMCLPMKSFFPLFFFLENN